jgi:hypothetical protein
MPFRPATSAGDAIDQPARAQSGAFPDGHRDGLSRCPDGLAEEQARRSLRFGMAVVASLDCANPVMQSAAGGAGSLA